MSVRRRNPIRTFLKKQKKTFAEQINSILDVKNDLSAREICTILYTFTEVDNGTELEPVLVRQHITNITKDFNKQLTEKLKELGIERYLDEELNVYRYKKCAVDA